MRSEVRLDRDAAVFDVSLHDGQYSIHAVRARFLQVLEGHVLGCANFSEARCYKHSGKQNNKVPVPMTDAEGKDDV
jgi:hypothetical protein